MKDFSVNFGSFSETQATIAATSEAGKKMLAEMFGHGAVSVNVPKSKAADLARYLEQKGLAVA